MNVFTADCMSTQMTSSTHTMVAEMLKEVTAAAAAATSTGRMAAGQVCGAASCQAMRGVSRPYALAVMLRFLSRGRTCRGVGEARWAGRA